MKGFDSRMTLLEKRLSYRFKNAKLLETALTHSSYANERRAESIESNERLEFLGDSILGMTVAEYLYTNYEKLPEGGMTRLRAELVCEKSLAHVASILGLGEFLRLGHGEEIGGGRFRPSVTADAVEAVIAAVYLDGGVRACKKLIHRLILDDVEAATEMSHDNKTRLQEVVQRKSGQRLRYELVDEQGPDHDKLFTVRVLVNGKALGEGTGRSKKDAEQAAAAMALEEMG